MRQNPIRFTRPALLAALLAGALHICGPAAAASAPGDEDLRALRFYVEHDETAAIKAEIDRLQAEFPGWTPPDNLNNLLRTRPTSEVAQIYELLKRGDISGARQLLMRTKSRYPSWEVPADLTGQMEIAAAQQSFDQAINAGDMAAASRSGTETPALFRCDRINNAWKLARLQESSGSPTRARETYRQVLNTCTATSDLVATIEKADSVTTDAQLGALIALAKRRFPARADTFDQLNERLLAGRGEGTAPAKPKRSTTASAAKPKPKPTRAATAKATASAKAAPQESSTAYEIPAPTDLPRTGDPRLKATTAAKDAGRFRECLAHSTRPRSLRIGYQRAWCAYNTERPLEAMAYFAAAAQGGLGGTVPRDARFGLALSLLKQDMVNEAAQVAARTDLTDEQRREVEAIILDKRGVIAFNSEEYRAAIQYFDALEQLKGALRRDLAIMRGYAYLNSNQRAEAHAEFQRLHDELATVETRKGLAASR